MPGVFRPRTYSGSGQVRRNGERYAFTLCPTLRQASGRPESRTSATRADATPGNAKLRQVPVRDRRAPARHSPPLGVLVLLSPKTCASCKDFSPTRHLSHEFSWSYVPRWRGWTVETRSGGGLLGFSFGCGYAAPGLRGSIPGPFQRRAAEVAEKTERVLLLWGGLPTAPLFRPIRSPTYHQR
jgi:hypothetical protein